jgi:hypothetical protein
MKSIRYGLDVLKASFRYKKVLLNTFYVLGKIGVKITPLYLTRESVQGDLNIQPPNDFGTISYEVLAPTEIHRIYDHPETRNFAQTVKHFNEGTCLCFALKQNIELMAFMFADLERGFYDSNSFKLRPNEAYIFGTYTYRKHRGKNLAPYLNYRAYKVLAEMGRTVLLSYTEFFNAPALNFKKKLGAKHLRLDLYIRLFYLFKWRLGLRKYPID